MSSEPAVSGKDAVRALQKLGFRVDRIEGSHHMLIKDGHPFTVPVPVHGSRVRPRGTWQSIIRMSGAGKRRFFAALKHFLNEE